MYGVTGQGSPPCSADKEEEQGQKADLLAAGCVLAELYLGRPVLSITDAHDPGTTPDSIHPPTTHPRTCASLIAQAP